MYVLECEGRESKKERRNGGMSDEEWRNGVMEWWSERLSLL
jgi:hypothetical protein